MVPSSESDPDAEQLSKLSTATDEDGDISAVVIVGAVFSTMTSASDVVLAPLESVAVAVQVMIDPTSVSAAVTVYVEEPETLAEPTDQEYVGVSVPSSASDPEAVQLRVLPTTTPELGLITAVVMVGVEFSTSTEAVDVAAAPLESVAVAVQVIVETDVQIRGRNGVC